MNLTVEKLAEIIRRPGVSKVIYGLNDVPTQCIVFDRFLAELQHESEDHYPALRRTLNDERSAFHRCVS